MRSPSFGIWPEEIMETATSKMVYDRESKLDSVAEVAGWLKTTRVIVDMINDAKPIPIDDRPSDPNANGGRGLLRQVYTPARDQNEWQEKYWDRSNWLGLQEAIFHFGHPIGELVFETGELVTHDGAIEEPVNDSEKWVELPAVYG